MVKRQAVRTHLPIPEDVLEKFTEIAVYASEDFGKFHQAIEAWLARDAEGAIAYLTQGEHPQEMLRWLIQLWGRTNPEKASQWLLANRDRDHYDFAVEGLTKGVASKEPESALEWAGLIADPVIKVRVWNAAGFEQYRHDFALAEERLDESGLPPSAIASIRETWRNQWHRHVRRTAMNVFLSRCRRNCCWS